MPDSSTASNSGAAQSGENGYDAGWVESLILTPERIQRYPRSSQYDPRWIYDNQVGSHCLWLIESLCQVLDLKPGQRVLDLGCGKAIESIFLAREFGVQVWATDLGFSPTDNWKRIREAGVEDRVFPIQGDARNLPFAHEFFDLVVSINSVQYYGTDDLYLAGQLIKMVKPGGQIGIVVPGLLRELDGEVPEEIRPYWDQPFFAWHSPAWWRRHWDKTGLVDVEVADTLADGEGYTVFVTWETVMRNTQRLVAQDGGRNISFVRLVARRK